MAVHIPTDAELLDWYPDPARPRFKVEVDIRPRMMVTEEVDGKIMSRPETDEEMTARQAPRQIELTLEEYRARHKAKMIECRDREIRQAEYLHGERFAKRTDRDVFLLLPEGNPNRVKAEEVEAAVKALGIRA